MCNRDRSLSLGWRVGEDLRSGARYKKTFSKKMGFLIRDIQVCVNTESKERRFSLIKEEEEAWDWITTIFYSSSSLSLSLSLSLRPYDRDRPSPWIVVFSFQTLHTLQRSMNTCDVTSSESYIIVSDTLLYIWHSNFHFSWNSEEEQCSRAVRLSCFAPPKPASNLCVCDNVRRCH